MEKWKKIIFMFGEEKFVSMMTSVINDIPIDN